MYAKDNTKNLFNLANSVAENFISNNLSDYQGSRNYDFGPDKRGNVSCLSPFITHRLILEHKLINRSLHFYPFSKIEKSVGINDSLDFIHNTNLEWLSLNWRKDRARKMSGSSRRLILIMVEEDYQYLPSLREIKDSLIRS